MTYVTKPSEIIGVDVAKHEVMVQRYGDSGRQRLANAAKPLLAWLRTLAPGTLLVMEATGAYHEPLARLAHALGLQVAVVNPRRSWHYGRALAVRGKTDAVDADTLAHLGAHQWPRLHRWEPPSAGNARLAQLLRRRHALVGAQTALDQSFSTVKELRAMRLHNHRLLAQMIARLDALIVQVVTHDAQLAPLHRLLQSIVGVGPVVAAQLAQALTRWPWKNEDAFVAYTGLDPRPSDSGSRRGRRKLTKFGPPMLRHLLYLSAMSAVKTNAWKPIYAQLRKRLKSTEALVVIARRIARIAFAMFRTGELFDANRLAPQKT